MKKSNWLVIGGDSLPGKEIRDLVEERKLPVIVAAASAQPGVNVLTEEDDEAAVIQPLSEDLLADASVVLLCGTEEANREALAMGRKLARRPAFIDVRGDFEDLPESALRAPLLEAEPPLTGKETIHTLAHPAATALARLLTLLHERFPLTRVVATVLEPASERGKEGIDELHHQAISLFNFQKLPTAVFDAQVSFNLLPRYGEEAKASLEKAERRMESHLVTLLGPRGVPLPSLRLVQAPVFHGHCQSVWVEFEARPAVEEVEKLLEDAGADVRRADVEPASNMGAAGQSGIMVSDIIEDRGHRSAMWLWLVSDNVRTLAENALLTAALLSREAEK